MNHRYPLVLVIAYASYSIISAFSPAFTKVNYINKTMSQISHIEKVDTY
jgi:hypothetical protein